MYDLFQKLKDANESGLKSSLVFSPTDGSRIRVKLREKLIRIAAKAGVDNLTKSHTLRHTFASHLAMQGVHLPTVKKLMGSLRHSDHHDLRSPGADHLAYAVEKLSFQ